MLRIKSPGSKQTEQYAAKMAASAAIFYGAKFIETFLPSESTRMELSADEVKEYWHDYCQRKNVSAELIARGDRQIEADPEHWADHTMAELHKSLSA